MIHLTSDAAIMYGLALLSGMIACGLLLSWKMLGGVRHALIWAVAFGLGAVQWLVIAGYNSFWHETPIAFVGSTWCGAIIAILLCLGFRERVALPRRLPLMIAAMMLSLVMIIIPYMAGISRFALAVPQFMRTVFLPVAALTLIRPGRRPAGVEIMAAVTLLAFAGFSTVVGGMRMIDCGCETNSGRAILLIGLPVLFTGTGFMAILLLASDLARQSRLTARLDPLTEALNRRGFEEAAESAVARARRKDRPLSVLLFDLDHFKAVNDRFSHADGDRVLRGVADCVRRESRVEDAFGRMGGEDFALLLDDTAVTDAMDAAERIRACIAALPLLPGEERVTASFGVAPLVASDSFSDALNHADSALYRAKAAGRNRTCLYTAPDDSLAETRGSRRVDRQEGQMQNA